MQGRKNQVYVCVNKGLLLLLPLKIIQFRNIYQGWTSLLQYSCSY